MPHEVAIENVRHVLRDAVALGRHGDGPLVCLRRVASGDAVVMTTSDATRDGLPLLGGLCLVEWGASALLRVGGVRIEINWRASAERRIAAANEKCRLCFGAFEEGEPQILCVCRERLHLDCDAVRFDCPACGEPRQTVPDEEVRA